MGVGVGWAWAWALCWAALVRAADLLAAANRQAANSRRLGDTGDTGQGRARNPKREDEKNFRESRKRRRKGRI